MNFFAFFINRIGKWFGSKTNNIIPVTSETTATTIISGKNQFTEMLMDKVLTVAVWIAYICVIITIAFYFARDHVPVDAAFVISLIAMIILAKIVGDATETISDFCGPVVAGVLCASCGNLPEVIIAIISVLQGKYDFIQQVLVGSILSNTVFAFSIAIIYGGWMSKGGIQALNNDIVHRAGSFHLLASSILLALPSVMLYFNPTIHNVDALNVGISVILIIFYITFSIFQMYNDNSDEILKNANEAETPKDKKELWKACVTLALTILFVYFASDILVWSIDKVATAPGIQVVMAFAVVSFAANVCEHWSGISCAPDEPDRTVTVFITSGFQIISLVVAFSELLSYHNAVPMSLVFNPYLMIIMVVSTFMVHSVIEDGKLNITEGIILLGWYVAIIIAFCLMK